MGRLIAVQGCVISYSVNNGTITASATVAPASGKVKCGNKLAYNDKINITLAPGATQVVLTAPPPGATLPTGTLAAPLVINVSGGSTRAKTSNKAFVLATTSGEEGDEGSSSGSFNFPGPNGTQVPTTIEVTAKVTSAGQNVVKAT